MLRISKLADYGIVLLAHIAEEHDLPWTARKLAEHSQLPQPTVSKLLKSLSRGGLLASERGVQGGYRLTRPPTEITVADAITVLDGPIGITECGAPGPIACGLAGCCPVRVNWERISAVVREALHGLTIADMARAARPDCGPKARQRSEDATLPALAGLVTLRPR